MILIDMHVHSTFSDGLSTTREIARGAARRGLSLVSLTDHDTTLGIPSFLAACKEFGVNGVAGIELAAEAPYTLHILGYRINHDSEVLGGILANMRAERNLRNEKICENLKKIGFDIYLEEVETMTAGEVVARPHIAALLAKKGYVSSTAEAFARYIGDGAAAYEQRLLVSAEECILALTEAGGVAVLAHPQQTNLPDDDFEVLLRRLKDAGLWGIEAIYPGHSAEEAYKYFSLADKYNLYTTAGTDFHGASNMISALGAQVSDSFLPWARLGVSI